MNMMSTKYKVIESGWWGKSPKVAEFEEKFKNGWSQV